MTTSIISQHSSYESMSTGELEGENEEQEEEKEEEEEGNECLDVQGRRDKQCRREEEVDEDTVECTCNTDLSVAMQILLTTSNRNAFSMPLFFRKKSRELNVTHIHAHNQVQSHCILILKASKSKYLDNCTCYDKIICTVLFSSRW